MEISHNMVPQRTALDFILEIFGWLAKGQSREPMYFNWSSVLTAVDSLCPDELEYLYNLSGTNNTSQMLAFINFSRYRLITMERLPQLDEFDEYQIRNVLHVYVPPVILAIGTLGNILSLVVLRSKPMVGVSSYTYLASLAVTDTVVLYTGLLRIWLMGLTGSDYTATADWICKLSVLFGYTASDLSVWLIIAVTVERYIVVCLPFRANAMCNVSRAKKVIGLLFGIILAINFHFLWTVKVKESEERCMARDRYVGLVEVAWPWVDAFIYSFIPFIIITVLNILISREVMGAQTKRIQMAYTECNGSFSANNHVEELQQQQHHHHHQQHQQQQQQQQQNHRRHSPSSEGTRLTIMLLTVSFTFLLLTLPVNILLIFTYYWNSSYMNTELSNEEQLIAYKRLARLFLIKAIIDLLMYTNHSINFFLYCATGQKFRRQFITLIRRCVRCRSYPEYAFRFRRSTRRTSGSVLGGNSEVTLSSRSGHRASSCVSFEMADCSLRWDCSHSNREVNNLLDTEHNIGPGNKKAINRSSSANGIVSSFHQHYPGAREEIRHVRSLSHYEKRMSDSNRNRFSLDNRQCFLQQNNKPHRPSSCKFNGQSNCKKLLKRASCCHFESSNESCKKRSFKVYFSSKKRSNASLADNVNGVHNSCASKGVNGNVIPLSVHQWRDNEQAGTNFNTKHNTEVCCV